MREPHSLSQLMASGQFGLVSFKIRIVPDASPRLIREFVDVEGNNPFRDWLDGLDLSAKARVQARVLRFSTGNLGDHKGVGGGVLEARIAFGPGYRVYFGLDGSTVVLLLLGGDKSTQVRDIRRARDYWKAYLEGHDGRTK